MDSRFRGTDGIEGRDSNRKRIALALAGLEARIGFVDDIHTAFAADELVVTVALGQRFQRITNLHGLVP